jgi:hypothetical protein
MDTACGRSSFTRSDGLPSVFAVWLLRDWRRGQAVSGLRTQGNRSIALSDEFLFKP